MIKPYCSLHTNTWVLGNFAKAESTRPLYFLIIKPEVRKEVGKFILAEDLLACQQLCPLRSLNISHPYVDHHRCVPYTNDRRK